METIQRTISGLIHMHYLLYTTGQVTVTGVTDWTCKWMINTSCLEYVCITIKELLIYCVLHVDVESTDGRGEIFQVVSVLPYFKGPECFILRHAFKKSGSVFRMATWEDLQTHWNNYNL